MGASSSTEQVPAEQREAESLTASTGALPMLQKAFSVLADPQTNTIPLHSLQQCFGLVFENPTCEGTAIPPNFQGLLSHLGSSIVDLLFMTEKGGVSWIEFLRGYVKCCGRMSASTSFNGLFRILAMALAKAGLPEKLQFESDDDGGKMSGFLMPVDVLMLLWMCYIMSWNYKNLVSFGGKDHGLPDLSHLVFSAVLSCAEAGVELNPWDCDILSMDVQLPAAKIHLWALKTVPSLTDCLSGYVHGKLEKSFTSENKLDPSCSAAHDLSPIVECNTNLLNQGRAWAISLTLRSTLSGEITKASFPSYGDGTKDSILYRSSLHGKGLNRFWSNVEGYNGPMLILIAASSGDVHNDNGNVRRWILGALTHQAFENRDMFYGSSGSLYAISPVLNVFLPSGKEKNFVYSHLHPTGRVYDPHPKPVGLAFGGSIGNERISIDEDFAKVTVRHHAVDKTYQSGSLFPSQGFLPVEALILDVEVWGLGGRTTKEMQTSYKKREELFTDQRRKVDLKTFSNWEDSPEKMMMDMVSNPNRVQREDR
ncbi:TLD domain-containing protein [Actinidia chinensis var. chinensis]|uniref:TLD domain-containing protein n=1 Tax=Actinidia chinensis var. chinensis TaxID=1590841 RepID=A0A2R6RMN1_ACTCC|nr:TLD domain-containing protein [Actinidia chinensis var. chinensis]